MAQEYGGSESVNAVTGHHTHMAHGMRKRLRAYRKILRDKEKKRKKTAEEKEAYSVDKVFRYGNFVRSARKCRKGVSWKASVQNYQLTALSKTYADFKTIRSGKIPKCSTGREITITERGKARIITPIHIKDRMVQKVLCDNALVPVLTKKLIYDNGASLEGKGVGFSRKRMEKHLRRALRLYGPEFYILTFDIKNFFGSIPHSECRKTLERYFSKELARIAMGIIKNPIRVKIRKMDDKEKARRIRELNEDRARGICLGSQESQIMALTVPNKLDHFIKDRERKKLYVRYMDDGVIIGKTKEELRALLTGMKRIMSELGMSFNEKKTHIVRASKGFTFLKVKYRVSNGKILKRLTRKGVTRMRRKLKKFRKKVNAGQMTLRNVYDSFQSWREHARVADSYKTVKNMTKLYRELFGDYGISKKGTEKHVLQADTRKKYRWRYLQY